MSYIGSKRSSSLVSTKGITLEEVKLAASGDSITKSDGTTAVLSESNGVVTVTAEAFVGVFPSGTKMLFQQTAAPTGWTKDTSHDNKALRVVSGTAGSGGSVAFTTAFASQAVSGSVGNTTLTEVQIPSHTHDVGFPSHALAAEFGGGTVSCTFSFIPDSVNSSTGYGSTWYAFGGSPGGQAHNHSFTGTAINMDVQYVDLIIATKD